MDLTKIDFPANSAIFHITKGLIFNRRIAFQVRALYPDKNERNVPIQNETRLKERLFERIQDLYNDRLNASTEISDYKFTSEFKKRMWITDDKIEEFNIIKFHLAKETFDEEDVSEVGGVYSIYPLTFVCRKCGDLQYINKSNVKSFNPVKCNREGCNGEYEQLSIMLFCETCGNIRPFHYKKKDRPVRLYRESNDSIKTYKVQAEDEELLDVFRLTCEHKDPYDFDSPYTAKESISEAESNQVRPLTVTEGSVYIPVAVTIIDIPNSDAIDLEDIEYILMAIGLNKFDFLESLDLTNDLNTIQKLHASYSNEVDKQLRFKTDVRYINKNKETKELLWKQDHLIDKIESSISVLKTVFPSENMDTIRELNDYFALTGKIESKKINTQSYLDYLNLLNNEVLKESRKKEYEEIKDKYGIESIIHISNVTLINSCIGLIHGINKFYESGFIPHFEPIWKSKRAPEKGFQAYSYPYITEGIVFTLNKRRLYQWLFECGIITYSLTEDVEIQDLFSGLKGGSPEYYAIKNLIHTLSHLLMRASAIYTGLDLQSYGEIVFPTSAALLIFSTSSINIGGLRFAFEHEVFRWFEDILFEVKECTLDPNCINDLGACFSCMYIPEFVCNYFNQYLDRDVFLGKKRYKKGFWQ